MPRANVSPEWTTVLPSVNTTGSLPSTASLAVAAKDTCAPAALVASTVWLATGLRLGAVVSRVKVSDAEPVLPPFNAHVGPYFPVNQQRVAEVFRVPVWMDIGIVADLRKVD